MDQTHLLNTLEFVINRYFAFEFCASDLASWADGSYHVATPSQFVGILGLANGLELVHANNRIHGHLWPRNILISATGDRLIIADSGLVKMVRETQSYSVTSEPVTVDSDTWSMGCLFYHFLTRGHHPFGPMDRQLKINIFHGKHQLNRK